MTLLLSQGQREQVSSLWGLTSWREVLASPQSSKKSVRKKSVKKIKQTFPHQGYITAFNLHSCYYYTHFADEDIELHKGYVPCLWLHS